MVTWVYAPPQEMAAMVALNGEMKKETLENGDESRNQEFKDTKGKDRTSKVRKVSELEFIGGERCQVQRADQTWRK